MASRTRPSDTFGTASSVGGVTGSVEDVAAAVEDRPAVELERGVEHDHVEVDGHRHRASDARTGAEGNMDGAEDLLVLEHAAGQLGAVVGADAELGQVSPWGAVRLEELEIGRTEPAATLD